MKSHGFPHGFAQADAESSIPFREDEDDYQEPPPHGWILNPDGSLGRKDGLIRQRMGRLLRGKKTWQKPRKIEEFPWDNDLKYDGFPMDFLISCVTLIRFAWGGWAKGGSICVLATWCCPLKLVYFQSVN